MLVGEAYYIVEVPIPGQRIGAEDIWIPIVLELLSLSCGVLVIKERNLSLPVDGVIDGVHDVIDLFIFGLDAVGNLDIAFRL